MNILEQVTLSHTEQDQVAQILSSPVIKRYFKVLSLNLIADLLAGFPGETQSDSEYIRKEAHYKGQLAVLDTLYSIKPINNQQE